MNIALNILAGPLNICLYILYQLQATFFIVNDGFMGRRPIEVAVVGGLVGWVVLAIIVAAVVFVAIKYVLESVFSGSLSSSDILPVLSSVFWRLIAVLIIYGVLSALLYASVNYVHMVSSGMNDVPPFRMLK
jgi:hypothetical protein